MKPGQTIKDKKSCKTHHINVSRVLAYTSGISVSQLDGMTVGAKMQAASDKQRRNSGRLELTDHRQDVLGYIRL